MPYLKRSEIIDRYGFDPMQGVPEGSGVSVVERVPNNGPAVVNEVRPNEEKDSPKPDDSTETSNPGSNALAGVAKSYGSDPLALYGLGMGVFDYAMSNLNSDREDDKGFAESLYEPGGLEKVKNYVQEYANKLKADNPDWTQDQVRQEIDKWRANSEDFYKFNAENLRTGLSQAMINELEINKKTGMNKLPSQETVADALMQLGAGVASPNFLGAIAGFATRGLRRAGVNAATKALDALIFPGTDVANYGVKSVATGSAIAGGIDQGVRYAQGNPNVFEGNAFNDFSKEVRRLPQELETLPPNPGINDIPLQTEANDGLGVDDAAIGAGVAAGIIGGVVGGRRIARTFQPNVTDPRVGDNLTLSPNSTPMQQQADQIAANVGLENDIARPTFDRISEALDEAFDDQSGLRRQARELGGVNLEDDVNAITETMMTASARENSVNRHFDTGMLPDGAQGFRPRDFIMAARDMGQETVSTFNRMMLAEETLFMRQQVRDNQVMRSQLALAQYAANPSPRNTRLLQQEQTRTNLILNDDSSTRYAFEDMDTPSLQRLVMEGQNNADAVRLRDMLGRMNDDITGLKERAGLISSSEAAELRQRPHFTSLFENTKGELRGWLADAQRGNTPGAFSPNRARNDVNFEFGDPERRTVNRSIDPFQSYSIRAGNAVSYSKFVIGAKQVLRELRRADPQGRQVQYLGNIGDRTPNGGYAVRLPVNGEMHTWVVARKSVADAFNSQALDLGFGMNMLNKARQLFQQGTTGPLAGFGIGAIPAAFRSLGYDILSANNFRRSNRSFGLLGSVSRQAINTLGGANNRFARMVSQVIDAADAAAFLPNTLIQVAPQIVNQIAWKTWGAAGAQLMDAAVRTHGVWRAIDAIPGGRQFLRDMGQDMWRAMESTPLGLMQRLDVYNINTMVSGSFGAQIRYDQMMSKMADAGIRNSTTKAMVTTMYDGWKAMLGNIHDAGKIAFIAQNIRVLEAQYGIGQVPNRELRRLAVEAKNLSGNMQAQPKNKAVKTAAATLPYTQQMMQSTRYMINSAFNHSTEQSMAVAMRIGGTVMAMYAGIKLIESMGLTDWYYDELADHQRVGNFRIPNHRFFERMAEEGGIPRIDPKKENPDDFFFVVPGAPEIMGYVVTPAITAMEKLGMLGRGKNISESNANRDMRLAIGNAIGLGGIPGVNAAIALSGQQIDLGGLIGGGRGVVQEQRNPRGMGIETGNTPGGLPMSVGVAAQAVFGLNGMMTFQALDAGMQANRQGAQINEAFSVAGRELVDDIGSKVPRFGMWKTEDRSYMSPVNNRINEARSGMELLTQQYRNEFSATNSMFPNRPRVRDKEVRNMLAVSYAWFERGGYTKLEEASSMIKKQIESLDSQKDKLNREQRLAKKAELKGKLDNIQDRQARLAERFDTFLERRFKGRFEAEGLDPNLSGLMGLVKKHTN